jgi:hypothetical protein
MNDPPLTPGRGMCRTGLEFLDHVLIVTPQKPMMDDQGSLEIKDLQRFRLERFS